MLFLFPEFSYICLVKALAIGASTEAETEIVNSGASEGSTIALQCWHKLRPENRWLTKKGCAIYFQYVCIIYSIFRWC